MFFDLPYIQVFQYLYRICIFLFSVLFQNGIVHMIFIFNIKIIKKTYTEQLIVEKNNDSESSLLLEQLMWLCGVVRVEE